MNNVAPIRLAIAVLCLIGSAFALRMAIKRMIAALVTWLIGGALFMAGMLFLVAGSWGLLRTRLARRRARLRDAA